MGGDKGKKPDVSKDKALNGPEDQKGTPKYLESERIRLEKENEAIKKGMRSIFEVGFPPIQYLGSPGYDEHVKAHQDVLGM